MTRFDFLKNLDNMSNHRILLWEALQLCSKKTVFEFGSGHGSTPFLKEYCLKNDLLFFSYDNNKIWAAATGSTYIENWDDIELLKAGVLFLDHAPGERRKVDLLKYKDIAEIIVIHDSEPTGAGDYRVRELFDQFKYKVDLPSEGAWATMLSNTIDVTASLGCEFENYKVII